MSKRLVGRRYSDANKRDEQTGFRELDRFAYPVECSPNDHNSHSPRRSEKYTPERILQIILQRIKEDAEKAKVNPLLVPLVRI